MEDQAEAHPLSSCRRSEWDEMSTYELLTHIEVLKRYTRQRIELEFQHGGRVPEPASSIMDTIDQMRGVNEKMAALLRSLD